ncbi:MAG TPA: HypC/HybG/HupF family hydrogenase formation chaperone [Actinoplanes sp.]|nr:HypC/HybG/HupF family hydrogenase formation chaperone [Actinoplanes sp.]
MVRIREDNGLLTGTADFGGVLKDVCLSYVPEVKVGEYVIVHVGFAITALDEEEARSTLEILSAMADGELLRTELAEDEVSP